eukprot:GFKZ01014572.1.p1 GENE.GFKZ01014572.1~~GFKZ01014572.1.p1  ORF type:complete len:142 (-),score=1.84 GFKZ01014572.1:198-623(-)
MSSDIDSWLGMQAGVSTSKSVAVQNVSIRDVGVEGVIPAHTPLQLGPGHTVVSKCLQAQPLLAHWKANAWRDTTTLSYFVTHERERHGIDTKALQCRYNTDRFRETRRHARPSNLFFFSWFLIHTGSNETPRPIHVACAVA